MCDLRKELNVKSVTGYKVVVKNGKDYYSLAMGFKYPKDGTIPVITEQKRLSSYFTSELLSLFYKRNMVGRTAAFIDGYCAERLAASAAGWLLSGDDFKDPTICVVEVKLSGDLMEGAYEGDSVVAGRKMEVVKEIKTY